MSKINEIKKFEFRSDLPNEIELLSLKELFEKGKEVLTSPHRAGFYHILWFQSGSSTHLVDFIPVDIKSNSILFLSKDTVHRFDEKGNFEGKALLFTDNFFCKTEEDVKYLQHSSLFYNLFSVSQIAAGDDQSAIPQLFQLIEKELKNKKDSFQSDILRNTLFNLLLQSERENLRHESKHSKKNADFDCVLMFKDSLEIHFKEQKQVSFFANQLSITEKRLNRATKSILGKTTKQVIDERVLLEAKRILAHSTESIKEIGYYLGFEEPSNFVKYFRKHQHRTPSAFRAQLKF
ncbi:helix-turn-helix domain-containing protein [Sphingobacterium sp. HJSM2_6]|uniref:helix-turn-helix domain-containing protein n=1 Tax=Sphingobacterium sp. HJSM2_6 TaxID=3366264 RepID=UPI003BD06191